MKQPQQPADAEKNPAYPAETLEDAEAQQSTESQYESDLGIMPISTGHGEIPINCPENDIILRIECITERQMKVRFELSAPMPHCQQCSTR